MNLFSGGVEGFLLRLLAVSIIVFFILPIHEYAHGFVAYKLGDKTAKLNGRLTLSPLAHVDWFGALMILLVGIGWGKPIPIDPRNFKRKKLYTALVALAGPLSNIIAAILGGLILNMFYYFLSSVISSDVLSMIFLFFKYYIKINVGLAIFNLIPLPPLDGSKIFAVFIPDKILDKMLEKYYKYQMVVMLIIMILLFSNVFSAQLYFIQKFLFNWVIWFTSLPFVLFS